MKQEGRSKAGGSGEGDLREQLEKRKKRGGKRKDVVKLSHLEVEEEVRTIKKKKKKKKKKKQREAESDSDSESSDSGSLDSQEAENLMELIKVAQRVQIEKQKQKKIKKENKKKRSHSTSSSDDEERERKKKKKASNPKSKHKKWKKNKKKIKKEKGSSRSTSSSESPTSESGSSSSDSEEDESKRKAVKKNDKVVLRKQVGGPSRKAIPTITSEKVEVIKVLKSKWETTDDDDEPVIESEPKKVVEKRTISSTVSRVESSINKDKGENKKAVTKKEDAKTNSEDLEKLELELDSITEGEVRSVSYISGSKSKKESPQKPKTISLSRSSSRNGSRSRSKYRSRSRQRSRPRYRSRSGYRSRSRKRSRSRYRSRSREEWERRSTRYRSRSREYRPRTRTRSNSRRRYRRGSRSRSLTPRRYRQAGWSSGSRQAVKVEPSGSVGLQERMDMRANIRRKVTTEVREIRLCSPIDPKEEKRKEFREKIDEFVASQTSQKADEPVARRCGECGEGTHETPECPDGKALGTNPQVYGMKQRCTQCFSYSHTEASCPHAAPRGGNPTNTQGAKLSCSYCRSSDHLTNKCQRIHCERLGRNPVGISGRKIACDLCNSFDHVGAACGSRDTRKAACDHCGSFNHTSTNCRELETRAFMVITKATLPPLPPTSTASKPGRTPIVYTLEDRKIGGESMVSVRERLRQVINAGKISSLEDDGFSLLPCEEGQTPCFWCKSPIHGANTCPNRHNRDFGVNAKNEYGVMQDCEACGSYNHMVDICRHSEENGSNQMGWDGKKLYCSFCNSFDHMLECKEKDNERNGRNKVDEEGNKPRCEHCGSWDHLTRVCGHTFYAGRNRAVGGRKDRCQFCGSFGHIGEKDCMKQSDIVRDFLRLKIGAEKLRTTNVKKIGKFEDFSHIVNRKTVVRDTLTQEEKNEQKTAEKKLKERLMAKFGIKGAAEEAKESSPKPEAQVAVYEEELEEGDYSYDEPDPSVFDGKDLRTRPGTYSAITEKMHNTIITSLRKEEEDVVQKFNINITKRDLYCLTGENWLNDKVLEFYLQEVAVRSQSPHWRSLGLPRVHCMSTYFFLNLIMRGYEGSIQRWNKDIDIFTFHLVLVPIHLQEHWCLAIIDFRTKALLYYDPMGGENMPALSALLNYIGQEHLHKKGRPLDLKPFAKAMVKDFPEQENTSDCGMFVAKAAEFFTREQPVNFTQDDMPYFRKRMIWEIIKGTLIYP